MADVSQWRWFGDRNICTTGKRIAFVWFVKQEQSRRLVVEILPVTKGEKVDSEE